jgi:hypothetical protein
MFENSSAILLTVLALAGISLPGCSRKKSIGRDEIRSEIRSARSFAAESELFIDFVLQGHSTRRYAEGHSVYLEQAVEQSAKELGQTAPAADVENSVRECRSNLGMLARELSRIRAAIRGGDEDALHAAQARIRHIRENLEKANSQL